MIKDAPNARIIRLRKNYRSAPEIVEGAAAVISHNRGEERCLEAVCRKGTPIRLITASSSWSEAIFTAKEINRLMGGIGMLETDGRVHMEQERSFGDIAVLYRTRRQSAQLEQCLRKEGIPYVVAGREDFLLEKKVRRTICFFKWLLRQDDTVSYEIGRKLFAGPEEEKEKLPSILETYLPAVRKEKPGKLLKQWAALFSMEEEKGIKKLLNMAHFYKNMDDFLDSLSFGVENDLKRAGESQYSSDAVTLMTLHSAKGLEFPEIILHGVQKGMLPLEGGNASQDLEEERRLFYVGMTRAKEALTITFSGEPSVFLAEIPNKDIVREEAEKPKKKEEDGQMSLFDFMR